MKTILKITMLLFLSVFLISGTSIAASFGDGGAALQGVLDDITLIPATGSSIDVTTDEIPDAFDSFWQITAAGGSTSTLIIELASFEFVNTFGIYDPTDPTKFVEIFDGGATAGSQTQISIKADGSIFRNVTIDTGVDFAGNLFGFYLTSPDGLFRSDTSQNADGQDHLYVYQGNDTDFIQVPDQIAGTFTDNEFILAWEDLFGPLGQGPDFSDRDFTDMVLIIESVLPVPEPATMLLSGLGLLGIGAYLRRRFKKA